MTANQLRDVRNRLQGGDPLITRAYQQLLGDAGRYLKLTPNPISGDFKIPGFYQDPEGQRQVTSRIKLDAKAANCLALAYALSGDERYALKAKDFLFAWVAKLGRPLDGGRPQDALILMQRGDTPLVITYTFPNFLYAYDILSGLGQLSQDEVERFRRWLRVYVEYCTPECLYKNNHHNWQSLFLMCSGVVLGEAQVFERGLGYYQNGFKIQVQSDGALPMEMWRKEKCATYTMMALEAMLQGAFIASRHGHPEIVDLRSDAGGSLREAVACLVNFLGDPVNWQVDRRRPYDGFRPQNRPESTSDWGWLLELPYAWWGDEHYLKYMDKRPYGEGIRAYSLSYSTLLFAR